MTSRKSARVLAEAGSISGPFCSVIMPSSVWYIDELSPVTGVEGDDRSTEGRFGVRTVASFEYSESVGPLGAVGHG